MTPYTNCILMQKLGYLTLRLPFVIKLICHFLFFSLVCFVGGTTYPWVVPLGTPHPKFLKPIQLYNNNRIQIKKTFHSNLFLKRLPKSCKLQNFNYYFLMCFHVENEYIRKKF